MAWSLLIRAAPSSTEAAPRASGPTSPSRATASPPSLPAWRDRRQRVIDAVGHVVAPGFIDAHSHSDLFYFGCPSAESKIRQGCTTEVVGMCSFSQAPIAPGRVELVRDVGGGHRRLGRLPLGDVPQYLDALRASKPSINVAQFVGHGALRLATVGPDNRPVTIG